MTKRLNFFLYQIGILGLAIEDESVMLSLLMGSLLDLKGLTDYSFPIIL